MSTSMFRRLLAVAVLTTTVAACGVGADEERLLSTPTGVVTQWLEALDAVDIETLATTTDPANLALVAGAENGFDAVQMQSMIDEGLPPSTARSYWTTFRDGLVAFIEPPLTDMAIHDADRYSVDGTQFAAVEIRRGEGTTVIITRLYTDGWKIDMTATVGPALAVQIRRLMSLMVEEGENRDVVRRYGRIAVSSLNAALSRNPGDRALDLELDAIEDLPIELE